MTISAKWYGQALLKVLGGEPFNWASSTIRVTLHTSGYIPDQDAHVYKTSLTNEVAAGGGYNTNGITLSGKSVTYDSTTNKVQLKAGDALWTNSTITAARAVIWVDTGTPATSLLLGYIDFGQDYSSSAADFRLTWDTTGVLTLTAA